MNINECAPGDKLCLLDFGQTDARYRRRLLALGITRGTTISIIRLAPLGCPVQIDVRGTTLALRKHEAQYLIWEQL